MNLKWFLSSTVRQATDMRKHVRKLLNAQRDVLTPPAIEAITAGMSELQMTIDANADKKTLLKQMESLEKVANKWLKPYPHSAIRENIEVILVAVAVAMAIRTFFLQPFKIPTGSMQPTLYGVISEPDFAKVNSQAALAEQIRLRDALQPARGLDRVKDWFRGVSFIQLRAKVDGELEAVEKPFPPAVLSIYQRVRIGGVWHWIWFPPDYGSGYGASLEERAGLRPGQGQYFKRGDEVVRMRVHAGDHLFVNRFTYNFRHPKRGEIIVFETAGTPIPQQDTYYIKRLVALGGEQIQIGEDRHLVINGKRLDATTPHFENIYSFNPKEPPQESHYSGHVNDFRLAPLFYGKTEPYSLQPNDYMVMGDNTMNSYDSRAWGEFSRTKVIGKSFFVYWPITERFGWGHR